MTEGQIKFYGQKYEELTTNMKVFPEWDKSLYMMKSDFFEEFLSNPSNERLINIKETIKYGLCHIRTRRLTQDQLKVIEEKENHLNAAETPSEMRMVVNDLAGIIQNLS